MQSWPRTFLLIGLLISVFSPIASAQVVRADGDPAVQTRRALALIAGDGVRKDVPAGLELLRRAAEKAHPPALRVLGDVFAAGSLVRRDDAFAVALYRAAAERGDADAQWELGERFAHGAGIGPDDGASIQWRIKAAAAGHARARAWLGALVVRLAFF